MKTNKRKYFVGAKKLKKVKMFEDFDLQADQEEPEGDKPWEIPLKDGKTLVVDVQVGRGMAEEPMEMAFLKVDGEIVRFKDVESQIADPEMAKNLREYLDDLSAGNEASARSFTESKADESNANIRSFKSFVNEAQPAGKNGPDITKAALAAVAKMKKASDVLNKDVKPAVEDYLHWFVNNPMNIEINKGDGALQLWTMAGSSLRKAAKGAIKAMKLDKWFAPGKMEFEDGGDDHIYTFPLVGSKAPDTVEQSPAEFVEDFVSQAVEDNEKWLRGEKPTLSNVESLIDDFAEHFAGEYQEDVYSKNKKKIASEITKRLKR